MRRVLIPGRERQIIANAQAGADGVNAYWQAHGIDQPPATVNDVIATSAFIGSIFGAGGGAEASNAELLATLQQGLGSEVGTQAWEDVMLSEDPEAPTTTQRRFDYGPLTGGRVTGSVIVDPGSIQSLDPRQPAAAAYLRLDSQSVFSLSAIHVLRVEDGAIAEVTTFAPELCRAFGLPDRL